MKTIKRFLFGLLICVSTLSLYSCDVLMYATTQDDIYVETSVDVVRSTISYDVIIRYGKPYYYGESILYYVYNDLYYYPYYYNNYWYLRAYRKPFDHLDRVPYFRPHKYDYRFDRGFKPLPNWYRYDSRRLNTPNVRHHYDIRPGQPMNEIRPGRPNQPNIPGSNNRISRPGQPSQPVVRPNTNSVPTINQNDINIRRNNNVVVPQLNNTRVTVPQQNNSNNIQITRPTVQQQNNSILRNNNVNQNNQRVNITVPNINTNTNRTSGVSIPINNGNSRSSSGRR